MHFLAACHVSECPDAKDSLGMKQPVSAQLTPAVKRLSPNPTAPEGPLEARSETLPEGMGGKKT